MAPAKRIVRKSNGIAAYKPSREEVIKRARDLIRDEEARALVTSRRVGRQVVLPRPGRTLKTDLARNRSRTRFTIDHLHPSGGNTLLVAEKKAGKTTLALNLVRALVDEEPFLGHFETRPLTGRVAFLNYELDAEMFREWARDLGIQRVKKVAHPIHIRGRTLRFWEPRTAARLTRWLRLNNVEFLIIDPAARAWNGLVDNENDNAQVGRFIDALDAIKRRSGVRDLLLTTHTGRARQEDGQERSRGATRLEDWMDAGWYLTKDHSGRRSLRAIGRDVDVDALDLEYASGSRHIATTGHTRSMRREHNGIQQVVEALAPWEGTAPTTSELSKTMTGDQNRRSKWIKAAEREGYIKRTRDGRAQRCSLTRKGRKLGGVERQAEDGDE
jgi:RecA-family ATPase